MAPESCLDRIQARFSPPSVVHLYFLYQGTLLLNGDYAGLPPGKRIYCAHSHRQFQARPPVNPEILPGGLANLGEMIRASGVSGALPALHWPDRPARGVLKRIAIRLAPSGPDLTEGLRLATGLAACNHRIRLHPEGAITETPENRPYLMALRDLGVDIPLLAPVSLNPLPEVTLQL